MSNINPGWRKLGSRDIVRATDVAWIKGSSTSFLTDDNEVLAIPATSFIGCQICTEDVQNYGNDFWRKLNNDPKEQTKV